MYAKDANTLVKSENGEELYFHDTNGIPRTRNEMDWSIVNGYIIPAFRGSTTHEVEKLLDYVDLKLDWYIPSVEAFEVINFIRFSLGKEPENLNSKAHYFFIDCMLTSSEVKPYFDVRNLDYNSRLNDTLILSTREFSKSVLVTFFILYIAWKGKRKNFPRPIKLGLYVSDNMKGNVAQTMDTIKNLVIKSEYLSGQFEYTKFNKDHIILIRHPRTKKHINAFVRAMKDGKKLEEVKYRDERTFTLKGIGASGGRGSRDADLGRPDFAVFDDLVANEEDAYSDTKLKTIESTIEGDVASSLHAGGSFRIFIGTAYHTMDPIYRRVTDGSILPIVFPRAEVAPHGDIYNDHGKLIKPALKKEEFISVWPDRMPFEAQRRDYMKAEISYESGNVKKLASLNQEFYIRVISSTERLIQTDNMKFVSIHDMKVHSELYSWFVTTDFTTSNKKGSDLSVAMLWARDAWGIDTLINISLGHKTIEEQYDDVFKLVDEGTSYGARYVEIGIEVDGPQQIHLYSIKKRAEETKRFIDIAKQINPQKDYKPMSHDGIKSKHIGDKLDRLRLRANDVDMGKVNINKNIPRYQIEEWTELETEFRLATREDIKSRYDDALDCFSQPVLIYVDLPSKELSAKILGKDDDVPQKTLMQLIMDGDLEHIDSGSNDYSILDY